MSDPADLASHLPSPHLVRAALHVASILGERSSSVDATRESYWHHATGGTFSPADLRLGEQLLIDCGLVDVVGIELVPAEALSLLLDGTADDAVAFICKTLLSTYLPTQEVAPEAIERLEPALKPLVIDEEQRRELLLELGRRFDDTHTSLIGAIGEECVVAHARHELRDLGRYDLAREVRRVSLISDELGYDVVAPRVDGKPRLLEVKTAVRRPEVAFGFFISRNEVDTGLRTSDWALVACTVTDESTRAAEILGWSSAAALRDLLPTDAPDGRWTHAQLVLPVASLQPGLPRLVT